MFVLDLIDVLAVGNCIEANISLLAACLCLYMFKQKDNMWAFFVFLTKLGSL